MAAKILRQVFNVEHLSDGSVNPAFDLERPFCWLECLAVDSVPPVWSADLTEFVRFPTHHEAEERAMHLRAMDPGSPHQPFAICIERDENEGPDDRRVRRARPEPDLSEAAAQPAQKSRRSLSKKARLEKLRAARDRTASGAEPTARSEPNNERFWWKKGSFA